MTLADDQLLGSLNNPALAVSAQGTLVAYAAESGGGQQLYVRAIDGGESKALAGTEGATNPFFSPDEQWVVSFGLDALRAFAQASRLSDAVWGGGEGAQYAVSDNGVIVSVAGSPGRYERRLVWVGRDGRVEALAAPPRHYNGNAAISPDGRRAAVEINAATIPVPPV